MWKKTVALIICAMAFGSAHAADVQNSIAVSLPNTWSATQTFSISDSATNIPAYPIIMQHLTSGTSAAGFGVGFQGKLQNGSGTSTIFGQVQINITTATAGSEDGNYVLQLDVAGALQDVMNFQPGKYLFGPANAYTATIGVGNSSVYFIGPRVIDATARAASWRCPGFGTNCSLVFARAGGSATGLTTLGNGDNIGAVVFSGYNGTAFSTQAQILAATTETWGTNKGIGLNFQGTLTGTPTLATMFQMQGGGHYKSIQSSAPSVGGCGSGAAIGSGSTDVQGSVTEGTLATGCVVTFAGAFSQQPSCVVSSRAGLVFSYLPAVDGTTLTITNVGALSSTAIDWHCEI